MSFNNPFAKELLKEEQEPLKADSSATPFKNIGLPKRPEKKNVTDSDGSFGALFEDDDEALELIKIKGDDSKKLVQYGLDGDPVIKAIEKNFNDLKAKYTMGGARAFRIVTADVLTMAPIGWFDKYEKDIYEATVWVQGEIASRDRSTTIGEAQAHPTEDIYQDEAFKVVYGVLAEYMDRLYYKGIEKYIVMSFVVNEIIGFSRIDPLWRDRKIDEILINGPKDIQVEIAGQLYRVPACVFRDETHLMNLIERLYGAINKTVSKMNPIVDGRLHDQSRMNVIHSSVAPTGPSLAIRRHPERYWTPKDLVDRGSLSEEAATFIGNLIYKGCSFVVIGGTSTGKTSFLNAMTGFYRNDVRILTLEDNLEMMPSPHKMIAPPMECKPPAPDRPNDKGVTMQDLVKAALRQRPDGIIVGEVRDGAAYDLAQALSTGHFGASTIHANNEAEGIYRIASLISQSELVSAEKALPTIAGAFDFIILLEHFPYDGSRRMVSISEVDPYVSSSENGQAELNVKPLWKFIDTGIVEGKITGYWDQVGELSKHRREMHHLDLEEDKTWDELVELSTIPKEYLPKKKKD